MRLQRARELVQRRARSHHIVDHDHRLAGKVDAALESVPDVLPALLPGQAGLRHSVAAASAAVQFQRQLQRPRQWPGDLHRLIEAPFGESLWLPRRQADPGTQVPEACRHG